MGSLQTSVWSGRVAGVPVFLIRPSDSEGSPLFRGGRIYGGGYNEAEAYLYFCRQEFECSRLDSNSVVWFGPHMGRGPGVRRKVS